MTSTHQATLLPSASAPGERLHVDLHVHSNHSPDSVIPLGSLVRCWERHRILPVVCDHDTLSGSLALIRALRGIRADVPEIPAMEITTGEGEIIGLFLTDEIPPGLSAAETLDRIRGQGALSLVPHPFCTYRSRVLRHALRDTLSGRIDIIEGYNGRNLADADNQAALEYARERGLPVSAGSDAHTPMELGRTYMALEPFASPPEFLAALRSARIHFRRMHRGIHMVTRAVKMVRGRGRKRPDH
ncbi:MAG: PHP domain-containing protein [Methanomicrobiales archaeon]|nr:PHP domain-containing protein [Methanomicrobiales archaeon]